MESNKKMQLAITSDEERVYLKRVQNMKASGRWHKHWKSKCVTWDAWHISQAKDTVCEARVDETKVDDAQVYVTKVAEAVPWLTRWARPTLKTKKSIFVRHFMKTGPGKADFVKLNLAYAAWMRSDERAVFMQGRASTSCM